jgi:parallel beta-helix repeat protein
VSETLATGASKEGETGRKGNMWRGDIWRIGNEVEEMKRFVAVLACTIIILTAIPMTIASLEMGDGMSKPLALVPPPEMNYIVSEPFRINNNSDFVNSTKVTSGNGSVDNPWIIENFEIDGSDMKYCIFIGNTTDHFIIRNCSLYNAIGINDFRLRNAGITLENVYNGLIIYNNMSNNIYGVYSYLSNENNISNNEFYNNRAGVYISTSYNNQLANNIITSTYTKGINLDWVIGSYLFNNSMIGCGIEIRGDRVEHWNSHNIDITNQANGKKIYYFKNISGNTVPEGAGQVILANCSNIIVQNQNTSDTSIGIQIGFSIGNSLLNNTAIRDSIGIHIYNSSENTISENLLSDNWVGIYLFLKSCNNSLSNNTVTLNSEFGVYIYGGWEPSSNNKLLHNNFTRNRGGLYSSDAPNCTYENNVFISNSYVGIECYNSDYGVFSNNTFLNNARGISLDACQISVIFNNYIDNCTYSGLSLYRTYESITRHNTVTNNSEGMRICSNNIVHNNTLSSNDNGISLYYNVKNVTVKDNIFSNNTKGIYFSTGSTLNRIEKNSFSKNNYSVYLDKDCSLNEITKNSISENTWGIYMAEKTHTNLITNNSIINNKNGIVIFSYGGNSIYHNSFINNTFQAYANSENIWDGGYPMGGNYWSDYNAIDFYSGINQNISGSDGIGDKPHDVPGHQTAKDIYPLMIPINSLSPIAYAGLNISVEEGLSVIFNGSGTKHCIGAANYSWEFNDENGDVVLNGMVASHNFTVPGNYTVTLNVTDAMGNRGSDTMTVTVLDITPPTAAAGPEQNITAGTLVTFAGAGSTDNVGIENYTWTFTYNGTNITLYDVSPTFRFWTPGNYTVTLTIRDAAGNTDSDTVLIIVNPVTIPSDDGDIWIIILGIALVTAALLGLKMLKGKKPSAPKTEEDAAEKPVEKEFTNGQSTEPPKNE